MADLNTNVNTSATDPANNNAGENTGGDPSQAVSSAKGENAVSTSETEGTKKTFTQAEMDKIIADRLARTKKDMPDKEQLKAFKAWQESQKTAEEKQSEAISTAEKAKIEAEQRASDFEAKYTAMSKGVKSDSVEDVIALAKVKVSETVTLEQAIDSVIAKYPQFSGSQASGITTGIHTSNNNTSMSGVEAAFYARNPDLKN